MRSYQIPYRPFFTILFVLIACRGITQTADSTFFLIDQYVKANSERRYDILQTLIEKNASLSLKDARIIYERCENLAKKEDNNLYQVLGSSILADVLFYQNDLDSSLYYYMLQGTIAERNGDLMGSSFGFGNAAYILTQKGQFAQALALRKRDNPMSQESNVKRNIADYYYNLGTLFYKMSEIDSAIFYISKAVELDKEVKNIQGMIHNLHLLIDLNVRSGNLNNAESLCIECMELAREIDYKRGLATCYYHYAIAEYEKDNLGKAADLIKESIDIDTERKDLTRMGSLLNLKAHISEKMATNEVEELYYLAMDYSRKNDNYLELINSGIDLAKFYFNQGSIGKSQAIVDSISLWTTDNRTYEIENEILDLKLAIYRNQNDQDEIIKILTTKNELVSEKLEDKTSSNVSSLEQTYELFQTEREVDRLILQNQLNVSKAKRRNTLYGALAVITLMLASLTYLALLNQRNRNKVLKQAAEEDHLRMNLLVIEKEMDSLRSQMNPHFLFNSLNSINDYIMHQEPRLASKYLTKFSRLMRTILNNSKSKFISLEDELEAVNLYMDMEKIRFSGKFEFNIEVEPNIKTDEIKIPTMLIQPYLENAVKHGMQKLDKRGEIKLSILQTTTERLKIIIRDNGIGREKASELRSSIQKDRTSYGTSITMDRITLLNKIYNVNAELEYIDHKDPAGTEVILLIDPILKNENQWKS